MVPNFRSTPSTKVDLARPRTRACFEGFLCGILTWFITNDLNLLELLPLLRGTNMTLILAGTLGALLGLTRAIWLCRISAVALLGLWIVVAFTPFSSSLALPLKLDQSPEKTQAIVVLQAGVQRDNDLGMPTLERTLHAIELLQQGFAPRLIVTEVPGEGSHIKAAKRLMKNLGINGDVLAVGPVHTTHDEAVLVSQLMGKHGWKKILLVTSPTHSLRSSLTFQKTGLQVVSTPCRESLFDLEHLNEPSERVRAFGSAMREIIGIRTYRSRGWL